MDNMTNTTTPADPIREALSQALESCIEAIDYLGLSNSPGRELDARQQVFNAFHELVAAVSQLPAPQAVPQPLTDEQIDLCRQWFNAVQDLSPEYLTPADYALARRLYAERGMRVPKSIMEKT